MQKLSPEELAELQSRRKAFERCVEDQRFRTAADSDIQRYMTLCSAVCPCCGYPTLSERHGWEVCDICDWEDDGQDDPPFGNVFPDEVQGGPNADYSLTEARRNFVAFRQKCRPSDEERFAKNERTAHVRLQMITLFDSVLPDAARLKFISIVPQLCELRRRNVEFLSVDISGEALSYPNLLRLMRERRQVRGSSPFRLFDYPTASVKNICPACGYDGLYEAPYESSGGSCEICSCCGFEFGVTDLDAGWTFEDWRNKWIGAGANWRSRRHRPEHWNIRNQLANLTSNPDYPPLIELNEAQLEEYVGDYVDGDRRLASVKRIPGGLLLRNSDNYECQLRPIANGVFQVPGERIRRYFFRSRENKVVAFVTRYERWDVLFTRTH